MNKVMIALQILLGFWTVSCGSSADDHGPDIPPPRDPQPIIVKGPATFDSALKCPKGTFLTYENFAAGFLSTYCLSCHSAKVAEDKRSGAPSTANFDTLLDASRYRGLLLLKTQGNTPSMPPGQLIPAKDRAAFAEWLNCGTPKNNSQ